MCSPLLGQRSRCIISANPLESWAWVGPLSRSGDGGEPRRDVRRKPESEADAASVPASIPQSDSESDPECEQ